MIELIIGPMFSSKTTTLASKLERASIAKKRTLLIRPDMDTRNYFMHSEVGNVTFKFKYKVDVIKTNNLYTVDLDKYDVIGIDEGQFQENLKAFCLKALYLKKQIYISALNASSEQKMFQSIIDVFPYCDFITKLNAVCPVCGSDVANYTVYTGENKDSEFLVGGSESYQTLCFKDAIKFFKE